MAKNRAKIEDQKLECTQAILPVKDALDVLNGRWKLQIIISLYYENKRFNEISKEVHGITDKVLSKELKDIELNKLISRTVYDTFPPTVEYAITEHGKSLKEILVEQNHHLFYLENFLYWVGEYFVCFLKTTAKASNELNDN